MVRRYNAQNHPHIPYDPEAPAGKTIAEIFEYVAEPHLIQPTFIYDFPLAISPLSKNKREPEENADWVERFEIFVGGLEIGNAFSELNDPEEQRRRFEGQLRERERGDEEAHQMDEDYIRALSYGLPPTAGEGVGIDRLDHAADGLALDSRCDSVSVAASSAARRGRAARQRGRRGGKELIHHGGTEIPFGWREPLGPRLRGLRDS